MNKIDEIPTDFAEYCQSYNEYPSNLLRTEVFGNTRESFKKRLCQPGLFRPHEQDLWVRDLQENATEFDKGRRLISVKDIEGLVRPEGGDPWWRFMLVCFLRQNVVLLTGVL